MTREPWTDDRLLDDWLCDVRRRLHEIPEPGFAEHETQRLILRELAALPPERLEVRTWRTGVVVRVRGDNPRRTLGYRCDMDGLPIQEETSYPFRSRHPGYMHACGHDLHMAIALGVVARCAARGLRDDVVVVFQPAEEGPGGAKPMLQSGILDGWRPDEVFALHIAPEYPVGTVATRPGILFANTSELFIDLHGQGGHAAYPHRANDMVVAGVQLVAQLQTVVARNVDPLDAVVITIGRMEAGTRQNVIASHCRLEGTIRTLSLSAMEQVKQRITSLVCGIEAGFGCRAEIDWGANYRMVDNHPALTRGFMEFVQTSGCARLVECREAMTGEDFGYFLEDIPGFMFWLGVGAEHGLHHARLEPDERALGVGVRVATGYIEWRSAQP
ncbi:MAG: N-acetyldiaminopimelate deacetylase [Alicyclobacillaceae bacterium]|nr:N-acetyldiaminopimelate deacetylase [Alicyclobacillaceae bacterium]